MPTADVTNTTIVTSSADCGANYHNFFFWTDHASSFLFLPLSTNLFVFACEMDGRLLSRKGEPFVIVWIDLGRC